MRKTKIRDKGTKNEMGKIIKICEKRTKKVEKRTKFVKAE
jgi:hypothetical protein